MKHIFRFCEGYDKIVYGLKHNLTLVRKTDDDAIFRPAAAGAGKVSEDKISWLMPHIIPADAEKFSIYKTIESKIKVPVAYRTRQCDMLSVPESTQIDTSQLIIICHSPTRNFLECMVMQRCLELNSLVWMS